MGLGAAACEPGTLSILRHLYPEPRDRARSLGIWAAVAGLALAMGPVIGGLLVGGGGWPAIFWFNVAAGRPRLRGRHPLGPGERRSRGRPVRLGGLHPRSGRSGHHRVRHHPRRRSGRLHGSARPRPVRHRGGDPGDLRVRGDAGQGPHGQGAVHAQAGLQRLPGHRVRHLFRGVLHLLPHGALPAGGLGLHGLQHRRALRPDGPGHDRRLSHRRTVGGGVRAAHARGGGVLLRRRRSALHRSVAQRRQRSPTCR